jgi:hypothetical protein
MASENWTVHLLRRRWKPTKEKLADSESHQPLLIRVHRACSWMQCVEDLSDAAVDERLVFQWIALNTLYGRWDDRRREPISDVKTLPLFFDPLFKIDVDGRLAQFLIDERDLVMSIFEEPHLSSFFWEAPSAGRARQTMSTRHQAKTWYVEKRWRMILDRLIERIYLLRCQIVHGASTCRGKWNRAALRRCSAMLETLIYTALLIVIDHGADQDWGTLCYPPNPANDSGRESA